MGAEIALTSARRSRIQQLADSGDRSAKVVQLLHAEPERFYSVTQIGITLMSLALGAIGILTITGVSEPAVDYMTSHMSFIIPEKSAHTVAHTMAQVLEFIVISGLHIVGGELAPKVYAFHKPEALSLAVAKIVHFLYRLLYPSIWFLNHASNALLSVLGQKDLSGPGGGHFSISEEELRTILVASGAHGVLDPVETKMIQGVFDLEERKAKDVMVPRTKVIGIPHTATLSEALTQFRSDRHHRYPIFDGTIDTVVDILPIKELLSVIDMEADPEHLSRLVSEIMLPALIVPSSKPLDALLQEFKSSRRQMAVVIDEFGGTAGLVTLEDILEEIVGEYEDESSPRHRKVRRKGAGGKVLIRAETYLSDLEPIVQVKIPPGEYSTLAGFIYHVLARVPEVGNEVMVDGCKLVVESMEDHRIAQVSLERLPVEPLPGDDESKPTSPDIKPPPRE